MKLTTEERAMNNEVATRRPTLATAVADLADAMDILEGATGRMEMLTARVGHFSPLATLPPDQPSELRKQPTMPIIEMLAMQNAEIRRYCNRLSAAVAALDADIG
jgi:hypothetical protein